MPKRNGPTLCPIDGCINRTWASRNLPICGDCAKVIIHIMEKEVRQKADWIHGDTIASLRSVIRHQQRRIQELEGRPGHADPKPTNGTVYYLRVGGYIKIGFASDLTKRMRSYAPDTVLLATEPGTKQDEQRRHRQFSAHRTHGREWYAMTPSLMRHIDQVIAEHGAPVSVAFSAQPVKIPEPRPFKTYVGGNYRGNGQRRAM